MFTYHDFIAKVDELGFIAYNHVQDGFPKVADFTDEKQWWSGDRETDPSLWAVRGAAKKKLAYGSFFQGKKGCLSPQWYPVYYRAFHPASTVEERYADGKLGKHEWLLWQLLTREGRMLGTHEIRRLLGVTPKSGASALDGALAKLTMTCDLIVSGEMDMLDQGGKPFNRSIAYDKPENWVPEWISQERQMDADAAQEKVMEQICKISGWTERAEAARLLRKQIKLLAAS